MNSVEEYAARAAKVERHPGDYHTVERDDGTFELELVSYDQPFDPHQLREVDPKRIEAEFMYDHVPFTTVDEDGNLLIAYG